MKTLEAKQALRLNNILFLTDFSEATAMAAAFAGSLARSYIANLFVLHTRPPVVNPVTPPASWYGLEEVAKARDEELAKEVALAFPGLRPKVLIHEGDLWANVTALLRKESIDLIVEGTHGRGGIARLLFGSVAEDVLREAACPVLTVGPRVMKAPLPGQEFTRILFATDFTTESNAAARFALSLAQDQQAHLTLLHVITEPGAGDLVQPHELVAAAEQSLKKLVTPESEQWCVSDFVVEQGNPAERILDLAKRRKAQLVILGVRPSTGFPGASTHLPIAVAHEVVSKAECPVLTVRA